MPNKPSVVGRHGERATLRSVTRGGRPQTSPDVFVEPWPGGGWTVRIAGHPVAISRHDTEEEALKRAAAYRRGLERERTDAGDPGESR
jgi:Uncharacterized protein conserved in bacteria (DUF2188)